MNLTRRMAMLLVSRAGLAVGIGMVATAGQAQEETSVEAGLAPGERRTLAAYLDTLIPDGETSPGAVATGLDAEFEAAARNRADVRDRLAQGCRWLDAEAAEAGATFAELDEAGRMRVVERAAMAPPESEERWFFEGTRAGAMLAYYAKPESWPALGYDGPPQPEGFMDYADPPASRT